MRTWRLFILLGAAVVLGFGCGGGGGGGGGGEPTDFSGTWSVTGSSDRRDCGDGIVQYAYTGTMDQTGSTLTFTTPFAVFTGTVSGTGATLSGSYEEGGGTFDVSVSLEMSSDEERVTGTASWTWTDGATSCEGTNDLTGARL